METLLVCLLAGYGVWLAVYLWWERRQREHPASQPDVTSLEREEDVPDIVGKSSFKMRATTPIAAKPTPQAATESKTASATEKAPTFAAGTDNRTAVRADGRHGVFRPPREWFRRCRGKDNGIDGLLFKPAIPDRRGRGDGSRPSSKHSRCACRGRVRHPGFCITIKNERTMKEKDYG